MWIYLQFPGARGMDNGAVSAETTWPCPKQTNVKGEQRIDNSDNDFLKILQSNVPIKETALGMQFKSREEVKYE